MMIEKKACAERFDWLRSIGGARLVSRLVELFQLQAPSIRRTLRQAAKRDDLETVSQLAHSMRSCAGNLGLVSLQELSERIEDEADAGKTSAIPPLVVEFEEALKSAVRFLESIEKETVQ